MDISAVSHIAQTVPTATIPTAPDQAAQVREVVQAVKALNQTEMFGQENELQFDLDWPTRKLIVRLVNRKTKEVVSQTPPENVLRLARDLKKS